MQKEPLTIYNDLFKLLESLKSTDFASSLDIWKRIRDLHIQYLKENITTSSNQLDFKSDKRNYEYANCYTYALCLKCTKELLGLYRQIKMGPLMFDVGFTKADQYRELHDEQELLERFYTDCEILGIDVFDSKLDNDIEHEGSKVAIYLENNPPNSISDYDVHFIRQNYDGTWSEKNGYYGKIRLVKDIKEIKRYHLVKTVEVVKPYVKSKIH